jgi:hypothetical protein
VQSEFWFFPGEKKLETDHFTKPLRGGYKRSTVILIFHSNQVVFLNFNNTALLG